MRRISRPAGSALAMILAIGAALPGSVLAHAGDDGNRPEKALGAAAGPAPAGLNKARVGRSTAAAGRRRTGSADAAARGEADSDDDPLSGAEASKTDEIVITQAFMPGGSGPIDFTVASTPAGEQRHRGGAPGSGSLALPAPRSGAGGRNGSTATTPRQQPSIQAAAPVPAAAPPASGTATASPVNSASSGSPTGVSGTSGAVSGARASVSRHVPARPRGASAAAATGLTFSDSLGSGSLEIHDLSVSSLNGFGFVNGSVDNAYVWTTAGEGLAFGGGAEGFLPGDPGAADSGSLTEPADDWLTDDSGTLWSGWICACTTMMSLPPIEWAVLSVATAEPMLTHIGTGDPTGFQALRPLADPLSTQVPVPGTLLLIPAGLLGLSLLRRRR